MSIKSIFLVSGFGSIIVYVLMILAYVFHMPSATILWLLACFCLLSFNVLVVFIHWYLGYVESEELRW